VCRLASSVYVSTTLCTLSLHVLMLSTGTLLPTIRIAMISMDVAAIAAYICNTHVTWMFKQLVCKWAAWKEWSLLLFLAYIGQSLSVTLLASKHKYVSILFGG